jgi:hypothetical protein
MDEIKLKQIIRKHKGRSATYFILTSLLFLSIHYFYQNNDAIQIMAYSTALVVAGLAAVFSFVEKVLLEINNKQSVKNVE